VRTLGLGKIVAAVLVFGPMLLAAAPAFVVPLVLYILYRLPDGMNGMRRVSYRDIKDMISRNLVIAFLVSFAIIFGISTALVYFSERAVVTDQARKELHFVIQILTGNWSAPPYQYPPDASQGYPTGQPADPYALLKLSFSAGASFVLNLLSLGLGGVVIWLIAKLRKERGMDPMALMATRDTAIRTALEVLLRKNGDFTSDQKKQIENLLREAIDKGDATWLDQYIERLFPGEAKQKRDRLHTVQI